MKNLWIVIIVIVYYYLGWWFAHGEVAEECRKLGGFYVGSSIFDCKERLK